MKIAMYEHRLHKKNDTNLSFEPIHRMLTRFGDYSRRVVQLGSNGSMSLRDDRSDRPANLQFNVGAKQVLMVVKTR